MSGLEMVLISSFHYSVHETETLSGAVVSSELHHSPKTCLKY